MTHYSETYCGYTITLINGIWRIAGISYIDFTSLVAAQSYIDKLKK